MSLQLAKRQWSLGWSQRLLVLFCAGLYVLAFHPWSSGVTGAAPSVYVGAAVMVVLAILPRRTRLISAIAIALLLAVALFLALDIVGVQA